MTIRPTYDDRQHQSLSKLPVSAGFVHHTADTNRQKRRALVKALGKRQFKKLYRKAQA